MALTMPVDGSRPNGPRAKPWRSQMATSCASVSSGNGRRRMRSHPPPSVTGSEAPAGLAELVAHRPDGLDEVGVLLAELGPQPPDVDVDRAGAAVVLVAPHPRQQDLA